MVKQIILITDGCSNVGLSPIVAAAHAQAEGITVNVIGILDQGDLGEKGALEVAGIAEAGGGMSRLVHSQQLAQTVQMMTRQTVACSIRQTVREQLNTIMGTDSHNPHADPIESLSPDRRELVIEAVDEMIEQVSLNVGLLIDTSASMQSKWGAVSEAVRDLGLSLQARQGTSEISVYRYPGFAKGKATEKLVQHTNQLAKVQQLFYNLKMKGTTPSGPALLEVVQDMVHNANGSLATRASYSTLTGDGLLSEYTL